MVEWAVPYYCYSANSAPPIAPPPPSSLLSIVPLVPSLSIETNVCPLSLLNLPRPQNVLEKKKNRKENYISSNCHSSCTGVAGVVVMMVAVTIPL